jgi:hypothetical protein
MLVQARTLLKTAVNCGIGPRTSGLKTELKTKISTLLAVGCCVFALSVILEILSSRCLYADGASEFLRVLEAQNFVVLMWSRHFAFDIYSFPLVVAIKLGVTQLFWLRLAFGLGCFLPWPLALLACLWISPRHFWLAAAGCAAGYLNAGFMAVGEHNLAHALFWPALFVILFAQPLRTGTAVILLLCATGLLFSYESQLFLSASLSLLALWRAHIERKEINRAGWTVFLVAASLFAASVSVGLSGVLMPEHHADFSGFKTGSAAMLTHMGWTLAWTVAWIALSVTAFFSETVWRHISRKPGVLVLFTLLMVWGIWPYLAPNSGDTGIQYDHRILDMLVPLALLPVALILRFRPDWIESKFPRLESLAAALLIAQSLWQISTTARWCQEVVWMREILASHRGIVPLRSTMLSADGMLGRELHPGAMGGRFDWTWPSLSIALTPSPNVRSFICSEVFLSPAIRAHYWQPFDPLAPKTLPDLRHYGVNYDDYVTALDTAAAK